MPFLRHESSTALTTIPRTNAGIFFMRGEAIVCPCNHMPVRVPVVLSRDETARMKDLDGVMWITVGRENGRPTTPDAVSVQRAQLLMFSGLSEPPQLKRRVRQAKRMVWPLKCAVDSVLLLVRPSREGPRTHPLR
jgi:hypothetical protein